MAEGTAGEFARYEFLPGLPPYGPPAEGFSSTGHGRYREGVVVRFSVASGQSWVGNFQPGLSRFNAVLELPQSRNLLVIAGGQSYLIDPETRTCVGFFGGQVETAVAVPERGAVITCNGLWLEAIGPTGLIWITRRISLDGIRALRREGTIMEGEALDLDDQWKPFTVDLTNGRSEGCSYSGPQ